MEINKLIDNIKKKISLNIPVESVVIEDKTLVVVFPAAEVSRRYGKKTAPLNYPN